MEAMGQGSISLRGPRTGSGSQEGFKRTSHIFKENDLQEGEVQVMIQTHICC